MPDLPTKEERASRAYDLQQEVVAGSLSLRRTWLGMAKNLYAIRDEKLYQLLGCENFAEWIAVPEVSLGRSQAYMLTGIYKELVVDRGIDLEAIQYLEPSKVAEVLPAIREGLDPAEALKDAEALSRSDLRAKYKGVEPESNPAPLATCPTCGQGIKP